MGVYAWHSCVSRRRHVPVVDLGWGAGHEPLVEEPSSHEAGRGPGTYAVEGHKAIGTDARATDFSRGPERNLFEEEEPTADEVS